MDRIGVQVIGGTQVALGRPWVTKLVDPSVKYVRDVRTLVGPDCLIVVRFRLKDQPLGNPAGDAKAWLGRFVPVMKSMADKNVLFEGYNEISDSVAAQYAVFEFTRLRGMHDAGLRSVIGNWSVGTPDIPQSDPRRIWRLYVNLLDEMRPGDVVGLHEYWVDYAGVENSWHCGRWWHVTEDLKDRNIIITECGRDVVEGKGKPGWQLTASPMEFYNDLRRYRDLLARFPKVLGALVFQVGSIDDDWKPFAADKVWPMVVSSYTGKRPPWAEPAPAPAPVPVPTTPKLVIDGRCMDAEQFRAHVESLDFWKYSMDYIFLHCTDIPRLEDWRGASTIEAMRRVYEGRGWTSGPHLFVGPDGVWLFTPLTQEGTHAGAYNPHSIGLEMVGLYDDALPSGAVLENTVAALAALFTVLRLDPGGIRLHRDYTTGKTCPGAAVTKPWIVDIIKTRIGESAGTALEAFLGKVAQQTVVPLDPNSAFEKFAVKKGWIAVSMGFEVEHEWKKYSIQVYRDPDHRGVQHVVWSLAGDWGNMHTFDRSN